MDQHHSFFETLLRGNRKLELDYEFACMDAPESAKHVRNAVAEYLDGYAAYKGISAKGEIASCMATVRGYANDIRAFVKTGKYPLELETNQRLLGRSDYHLFLI